MPALTVPELVERIANSVIKHFHRVTYLGTRADLDNATLKPKLGMTGFLVDEDVFLVGKGEDKDPAEYYPGITDTSGFVTAQQLATALANINSGPGTPIALPASNTALTVNKRYTVNVATGEVSVLMPASADDGDVIGFLNLGGSYCENNLTLNNNGENIMGANEAFIVDLNAGLLELMFVDNDWRVL